MKLTRKKFLKTGLTIAAGAIAADAFGIERFFIETNEFYLGSTGRDTKNIKVVQVSDLHLHSLHQHLRTLAADLNKLQPDLVLFTGDSVDKAKNIYLLDEFLRLIDKNIRKVAVLGNWEYQSGADLTSLNKVYLDNNCTLLINQTIQFKVQNKTVSVTGVDDFLCGKPDFETAIKDYKPSDHHIVLSHCPQYSDDISSLARKDVPVDFILSGHTHGGQITLLGFAPYLPMGSGRYLKGWYNDRSPKLYVSKGIGTGPVPVRFGARAEIAIFNLEA